MPKEPNGAGSHYRFDHLSLRLVLADMRFKPADRGPGDQLPAFDLPTLGGGRFGSGQLAGHEMTLLIFGSATCPVTDNAAPGLNQLHQQFGNRIRFVLVNVREAHPGRAWPQPRTIGEKTAHAAALRDLYGFAFEVAVDGIDGGLHREMSPKPNSAYLVGSDGTILFRAHWANDTQSLERALQQVTRGQRPAPSRSCGVLRATFRMLVHIAPVLDRAGAGAWRDFWKVAPPLAAMAAALKRMGAGREHSGIAIARNPSAGPS